MNRNNKRFNMAMHYHAESFILKKAGCTNSRPFIAYSLFLPKTYNLETFSTTCIINCFKVYKYMYKKYIAIDMMYKLHELMTAIKLFSK